MSEGSSEDDLDWFERAVRDESDGEEPEEEESDPGETGRTEDTAETQDAGMDSEPEEAEQEPEEAEQEPEEAEQEPEEAEQEPEEGEPESTSETAIIDTADGDSEAGSSQGEERAGTGVPTAEADGTEGTAPGAESGEGAMDDISAAFDMDTDDGATAGPASGTGEPSGDFGMDMDSPGGPGGDFGFGVSQEPDSFEEEEYQTDVPRIDIGIDGLDEMIQEGIPERALLVAIGGAGTGKTTIGLQFINQALENGERGVFITLEESHERIIKSAHEKGWAFEEYEEAGDLAVVDLDPVDMANSLTSIRNELPRLVDKFGASRLVLDSVSLLEMMYDDQATRRTEIYDFARSLKAAGVSTLLTSEADEDNPFASRFGVIEYLTDGVFILRYVRPEDFRETRLAIEIQKIRDANHSRETKPYEITSTGISVYRQANIF